MAREPGATMIPCGEPSTVSKMTSVDFITEIQDYALSAGHHADAETAS